jgi:hypothetical protein
MGFLGEKNYSLCFKLKNLEKQNTWIKGLVHNGKKWMKKIE